MSQILRHFPAFTFSFLGGEIVNGRADFILAMLEKHGGNKKETAREHRIKRNTLWRKLPS